MLQLAFCDDDLSELQTIQTLLDRYRVARNQEIRYTAFQNAWDLLAEVERGTRYDVLLLDVLMPGQNGIEVAGELRQYDNNVKIIFLTSSPEFAVQSYAVGAYFYQLLEYVQTLSYRAITLACLAEIPIPRGKYNEVKSAFLDYAFQKGQVTV